MGTPRGGLTVEDGRSRDVAYPRGMSDIPQLLAAIDSRLADLAAEITALETRQGGARRAAHDRPIARRRHRRDDGTLASSPETSSANALTHAHRPSGTTLRPVMSVHEDGSATTPKRSTPKAAANGTRRRRAGVAVGAETLERLLADTSVGLSANAIAERAGAGYDPTLKLLRKLEAARPGPPVGIAPLNRVAADHRRGAHRGARGRA